jgi:hypothetical protein
MEQYELLPKKYYAMLVWAAQNFTVEEGNALRLSKAETACG